MKRWLVALLLFAFAFSAVAASVLRTVPLKHRMAEEMAALVRPVAPEGVTVVAADGQLLLRGEESQVRELSELVAKLDVGQKALRISVRQGTETETAREGISVGGKDGKPNVRAYGTHDRDEPHLTQQLQTMEGQWARIDMGKSFPVVQQSVGVGAQGVIVQQSTEYKDVSSGFEVLPRIAGDIVSLEVRAYRGELSRHGGGVIENAQVQSTVQGKLGEWIDLGGSMESIRQDRHGTVYSTRSREQRQSRVQMKVELIP